MSAPAAPSTKTARSAATQHSIRRNAGGPTAAARATSASGTDAGPRKTVFKPVLDTPYHLSWPTLPSTAGQKVLETLVQQLKPIGDHRFEGRKGRGKKRKREGDGASGEVEREDARPAAPDAAPRPHPLSSHLTIGINACTSLLTPSSLVPTAPSQPSSSKPSPSPPTPLRILAVCQSDVNPPSLIAHVPQMVAAWNGRAAAEKKEDELEQDGVLLVQLPKGSEAELAAALGLRRVAVLGIHTDSPFLPTLLPLLAPHLRPFRAAWLDSLPEPTLIPTHIKQLKTSAPADVKRAKAAREVQRAEKKARVGEWKEKKKAKTKREGKKSGEEGES